MFHLLLADPIQILARSSKGKKKELAKGIPFSLEAQGRTGRIVVNYRLGALGSVNSLLCGVKRRENAY